jgi:formate dehydrogenase maturation protein FdhE
MSNEFKNEVFRSFEPNPVRLCNACGEKPALIRTMLDSLNGCTVRMYKCNCGEQTWAETRGNPNG